MPPTVPDWQVDERLEELHRHHLQADPREPTSFYQSGRGYYPEDLAGPERDHFGIAIVGVDGRQFEVGDHDLRFPLQSISKVFAYALALEAHGRDAVLQRVGVEPSGDSFTSIVFDERNNRPFNPMVNAGALVATDLVPGDTSEDKLAGLLHVGDDRLEVDEDTFEREIRTADRNRAVAYLMRDAGMLSGDVEAVLRLYLRQCSVHVSCRDLAVIGATLANGGVNPLTGRRALPRAHIRDVLSVMFTCGMYDFAGEWAYDVGLPAKSSVSGAILCVAPGKSGLGVFSPGLDRFGNSVRGVGVCREISRHLGLHVFATEEEDSILGVGTAAEGG
ncbi:MAG: glutaminase A [Candidatus Dormibacteraeota bacterium]|nr:glutaminase A [Candidatus Dormibacteraeota bacterium]